MDQRPADAPVTVDERMDGFELRVSDGGLSHRRQRVVVAEGAQVGDKLRDRLGRRRDVLRRAGVEG